MHIPVEIYIIIASSVVSFIYYMINGFASVFYSKNREYSIYGPGDVTVVMPVYNEDVQTFRMAVNSIARQKPARFIVVGDSSDEPYRTIATSAGAEFYLNIPRQGKRKALAYAMRMVKTPLVMFVDSDTIVPDGAIMSMASKVGPNIGGVGANIGIINDGRKVSYSSEFVERMREIIFRALSKNGSTMVLDGRCCLYRTGLISELILSEKFTDPRVLGKRSVMGDDRQMTSYIISKGYRAIKDFDVKVLTKSQESFRKFFRQQVRWARVGWYYYFKELLNGTARKAGALYTFEQTYAYTLPILLIVLGLMRFYDVIYWHLAVHHFEFYHHFHPEHLLTAMIAFNTRFKDVFITRAMTSILDFFGLSIFAISLNAKMGKERLRVWGYGAIALLLMFITTVYGLFTFWKQGRWLTR
ncbi:glycosyltransferase [Thermogymnomonas acidicola]|uniref:glycosyltransferase n=1 Tax=Thermogymnomonas acidicola TaxID=399579 RepID=UPI0016652E50|nr:glycosyltransferase [Thermogymnomonas acidicola]